MGLVVGVDMATAEVRALAVDAVGAAAASASVALPAPASPRPGWSEQDAGSWWPAVAAALRDVSAQLGPAASEVSGVAVCATSGTVVALDAGGSPLGPALLYADQRAVAEAEAAQAAGAERWAALGLRVQASFGLPKWAWLVDRAGAGAVARLAHAPDVVVAALVGGPAPTDWSHALKSGYDPRRREWAGEALAAVGLDRSLLPEVRPPATVAGTVTAAAARVTGLPAGTLVRLGMTDGCASQLAAGAGRPGQAVSVLGSTLVLKGVSRRPVADPGGAVYSHLHPGGWWMPGGASSTGGRALAAGFPGRPLAELDRRAAARGPAGAVAYPLVGRGERFPFVRPEAEGFVVGEAADEVERYRAVLEGVAFLERLGWERMAALGAPADGPVVATGRGSASGAWTRIRATVLGRPLMACPAAGSALGACMLAAAGGLHPDLATATAAMAPAGRRIEPVAGERDALERSFGRFVEALTARGWWPPG